MELRTANKTSPATVRGTSSIVKCSGVVGGRDRDVNYGGKGGDANIAVTKGDNVGGGENGEDDEEAGDEDYGEVGSEDDEKVGDGDDDYEGDADGGDVGDEADEEAGDDDVREERGENSRVSDASDEIFGGITDQDGDFDACEDGAGGRNRGDGDVAACGDSSRSGASGARDTSEGGPGPAAVAYAKERSRGGRRSAQTKDTSKAVGSALHKQRPGIPFASGDAALKAGVSHAVITMGVSRVVSEKCKAVQGQAVASLARGAGASHHVIVVGRRTRRSARLLIAMANRGWVVSDTWLLDFLRQRA